MSINNFISGFRKKLRDSRGLKNEQFEWTQRNFSSPSPAQIKRSVLLRLGIPNATWVETGTFMGDTTACLAAHSKFIYTIEPENALYQNAVQRFKDQPEIKVIHGLSEEVFPMLLPTLTGSVNFWLDGHYSGGLTHQGPVDCPVRDELLNIEKNLPKYEKAVILVDDVRCFNPNITEYKDYPDLNYLVDWARKNNLTWHIEHDIFSAITK